MLHASVFQTSGVLPVVAKENLESLWKLNSITFMRMELIRMVRLTELLLLQLLLLLELLALPLSTLLFSQWSHQW